LQKASDGFAAGWDFLFGNFADDGISGLCRDTLNSVLNLRENVPLAPFTTFRIGGPARFFAEAQAESDVVEAVAYAVAHGLPLFLLGGGSNLLVPDEGYSGLVLQMKISGVVELGDGLFEVGAGAVWDDFVDYALAANCAGVECLAGIPGSAGGTPVQNVGAYGQEVSETIVGVRAFDRQTQGFVDLTKEACNFRYRASLFNTDERNRYVVASVRFQLHTKGEPTLKYADLQRHFAGRPAPTLAEVAAAVREIRRGKGMLLVEGDPDTRSAGSFFKNPIVASIRLPQIAMQASMSTTEIPHWNAGSDHIKLPAAWLLEQSGFVKGFGVGRVGISSRHTLALVNRGGATFADVLRMEAEIVDGVQRKFGIRLEREPVLLA
jgi:UDP-N-acetylmuramate dehydrogenase